MFQNSSFYSLLHNLLLNFHAQLFIDLSSISVNTLFPTKNKTQSLLIPCSLASFSQLSIESNVLFNARSNKNIIPVTLHFKIYNKIEKNKENLKLCLKEIFSFLLTSL